MLWTLPLLAAVSIAPACSFPMVRRAAPSTAQGLSTSQLVSIRTILNETASLSWEIGTHMQALLEHDYPSLAPYMSQAMPPKLEPMAHPVLTMAANVVRNKSSDSMQLVPDGSAADPASIGVGVILANLSMDAGQLPQMSLPYGQAAQQQLEALLVDTPRTADGAISHRVEQVQLWSDFVYMVPPFLAYYGAITNNSTLLQAAYDQCRLYRQYLRTPSGLWIHIAMGSFQDPGLWATGNGWAAAGMLRTAATLMRTSEASARQGQISDLQNWSNEIVVDAFNNLPDSGLFRNYINESTFSDAASTALLTSASYRLAQLGVDNATIPKAEVARQAVYSSLNSSGYLSPVVNPLKFDEQGTVNPEGQAFVLLMEAAWRDWYTEKNGKAPDGTSSMTSDASGPGVATWRSKAVIGLVLALVLC